MSVIVPANFADDFAAVAKLAGWPPEVIAEERNIIRAIIERGPEQALAAYETFAWLRKQLEQDPRYANWRADYAIGELQSSKTRQ